MGFGRWSRFLPVSENASVAAELDLISYRQAIPDARKRRGVSIPAWYLLHVAVLAILSGCRSLRDLERYARRHHGALTKSLGLELRRPNGFCIPLLLSAGGCGGFLRIHP
jgi:hypothetical protein